MMVRETLRALLWVFGLGNFVSAALMHRAGFLGVSILNIIGFLFAFVMADYLAGMPPEPEPDDPDAWEVDW